MTVHDWLKMLFLPDGATGAMPAASPVRIFSSSEQEWHVLSAYLNADDEVCIDIIEDGMEEL